MISEQELKAGIHEFWCRGKFIRDRRRYENLLENCVREHWSHRLKRCAECDQWFDASRVTTRLFCEACLISWSTVNESSPTDRSADLLQ